MLVVAAKLRVPHRMLATLAYMKEAVINNSETADDQKQVCVMVRSSTFLST